MKLFVRAARLHCAALFIFAGASALPAHPISSTVQIRKNIAYVEGAATPKQQLDLYLPKGKADYPVMVFLHGGFWSYGDRGQYGALGEGFARQGVGVVIPSYRLAPADPHPAQIEDAAAAFAWVRQHIAEYGGDPSKIYVAGHSAGGHLASLLALNPRYLQKYGLSPAQIKGVVSISGAYVIAGLDGIFGRDPETWREASPLQHVHAGAPRFVVVYCEQDFPTLPEQAKAFYGALQRAGVPAELVYVPGETHQSEMYALARPQDPTAQAILRLIQ